MVEIQDNKENSSSIVEINEDELEIESAHLQSDSSSPSKIDPSELFKQRNGLNYGQDVKNI